MGRLHIRKEKRAKCLACGLGFENTKFLQMHLTLSKWCHDEHYKEQAIKDEQQGATARDSKVGYKDNP